MSWDMKPAILNRLVPKKGDLTSQLTGTRIKNIGIMKMGESQNGCFKHIFFFLKSGLFPGKWPMCYPLVN